MSFIIRGGYDIVKKQILNIALKPSTIWHHGLVYVNKSMVISPLYARNENNLELVTYNDTSALILNNSIIYENDKLFDYSIELTVSDPTLNWNDNSLDHYLVRKYVDVKKTNNIRTLN